MLSFAKGLGEKLGILDKPRSEESEGTEMDDLSHLSKPAKEKPLATGPGTLPEAAKPFGHYAEDGAKDVKAPTDGAKSPEKTVEEMVTLYHMTTPDGMGWADGLAQAKDKGTEFGGLKYPIDPGITKAKRTATEPGGDGRGGDDLGPGFYTTSSADFIKYYAEKNGIGTGKNQGGVLSFEIAKKALEEGFKIDDIASDDDSKFKQYIKKGFGRLDEKSKEWSSVPELDTKPTGHDILRGPINDVDKQSWPVEDGQHYKQGEILQLPDGQVPQQVTFASDASAKNLYSKSNIQYADLHDWLKAQKKEGSA